MHAGIRFLASLALAFGFVPGPAADERPWLVATARTLETSRGRAQILDESRLSPGSRRPVWSFEAGAPGAVDMRNGSWSVLPRAGIQVASPGPVATERVTWKLLTGGIVDLRQDSVTDPFRVFASPYLSLDTNVKLAPSIPGDLPPNEMLRSVELANRIRDLDYKSLSGLLESATLAVWSATAWADAKEYLAQAAYREKNLRRFEILMQGGKASRADYLKEKDSLEQARSRHAGAVYDAERQGREARSLALSSPGEGGTTKRFDAADLEALAGMLAPLLETAEPGPAAASSATAPWDLRLGDLYAQTISTAPRFTVNLEGRLGLRKSDERLVPVAEGMIHLQIPLGGGARERERNIAELSGLRAAVADEATEYANRSLREYRELLAARTARIAELELYRSERVKTVDMYGRLLERGAVTEIDRLTASMALAEVESALDRARAGYFLDTVTALVGLRIPMAEILRSVNVEQAGGM